MQPQSRRGRNHCEGQCYGGFVSDAECNSGIAVCNVAWTFVG